jgi:Flp pilus assembly protein TadD
MPALLQNIRRASVCALLLGSAAGCAGGCQRNAEVASRLRIASVAEASGQTEVAMSVLSSLASTAPDNADVQARYARALARSNRVSEADAAVSQALRRKPGDPVLLTELGRIRLLEGRAAEASEAFGAVLTARPRELGAVLGRGIAQDLLGQHTEAQASYRAVLAADPQNMPALNNLALSMVLAGDPGSAVPMLQRLASRGDAPARIRNNLSVAQAAVGEQGGLELPSPVAAAPSPVGEAASWAGSTTTAQREALQPIASPNPNATTNAAFASGMAPAGPVFTDGIVAMEPIPDRPRRVKPAPKAPVELAAPAGE